MGDWSCCCCCCCCEGVEKEDAEEDDDVMEGDGDCEGSVSIGCCADKPLLPLLLFVAMSLGGGGRTTKLALRDLLCVLRMLTRSPLPAMSLLRSSVLGVMPWKTAVPMGTLWNVLSVAVVVVVGV